MTIEALDRGPETEIDMTPMKRFLLAAAVVGTVVPWLFFGRFLADEGIDLVGFVEALFANPAAGGLSADLIISSVVFWVWSADDARRRGFGGWWIVIPANLLIGLSLALLLYLFLRPNAPQRPDPEAVTAAVGTERLSRR